MSGQQQPGGLSPAQRKFFLEFVVAVAAGLLILSVQQKWWWGIFGIPLPLALLVIYQYRRLRWVRTGVTLVVGLALGVGASNSSWVQSYFDGNDVTVSIPETTTTICSPCPTDLPTNHTTTASSPTPASSTPIPEPSIGRTTALEVTFTSPADLAEIPLVGAPAAGKVIGDYDATSVLWLFVFSPDEGGVHYVTDRLTVSGDNWALHTGEVGDEDADEVGKLFTLEVVLANAAASAEFEAALDAEDYDGWPAELPEGAVVVATRAVKRV